MKITIKLSETNNALLNRVVKEEKVDASEFANSAFLDKFLPVSEKLGIEAGFILQEHEAGTLDAWLVKQCISRGIRWLGNHPIRDCAILKQILVRFPFSAKDNGKISTCNECVQSDMDSVVALLKERVPGYVPSKDEYNGLVEDVLANWKYIWNEAIVYNVLATIGLVGSGESRGVTPLWQGKPARAVGVSAETTIPCMTQQTEAKCAA